jgi:hypothetical protein
MQTLARKPGYGDRSIVLESYRKRRQSMTRPRSKNVPGEIGVSQGERNRLIIIFLMAGAITAAFLSISNSDQSTGLPIELPSSTSGETPHIDVSAATRKWNPPIDKLNGLVSDSARLGRVQPTPQALQLLAPLVKNWSHVWFKNDESRAAVGGFRIVDWNELSNPDHARRLRGEPIEISGTVKFGSFKAVDPSSRQLDPEDFPLPLFEGIFEPESGGELQFLMVQATEQGQFWIPIEGDTYKLSGVFYRLTEEDLDGRGLIVRPFVLGTRLSPKVPLKLRTTLPEGIGERLAEQERTDIMSPPKEERSFYDVIGYVLAKGEDAVP